MKKDCRKNLIVDFIINLVIIINIGGRYNDTTSLSK
jgi:hypothetical protein